jgi:hypothetical protein
LIFESLSFARAPGLRNLWWLFGEDLHALPFIVIFCGYGEIVTATMMVREKRMNGCNAMREDWKRWFYKGIVFMAGNNVTIPSYIPRENMRRMDSMR